MIATNYVGRTEDRMRVYVTITLDETEGRLSISGLGYSKGQREAVSSGQIRDMVGEVVDFTGSSFTPADRDSLLAIWERWHLNDMRAECEHQRAAGWDTKRIDESKPADSYGLHYEGQKNASWNLAKWVYPAEYAGGLLTKECPECGYKCGTAWRMEEIPQDVRTEVVRLMQLPRTLG